MDVSIIEAVRARYQYNMKSSVSKIKALLNNNEYDTLDKIDKQISVFTESKERATHFESILGSIVKEEEDKHKKP